MAEDEFAQDGILTGGRPDPAAPPAGPVYHYAVGLARLAVLQAASKGFYSLYWFYAHWRSLKDLNNEDLSPFWRAVFTPFTSYFLFARFEQRGAAFVQPAGVLAALIFAGNFAWNLRSPMYLLAILLPLVVMLAAQKEINAFWRKSLPTTFRPAPMTAGAWAALAAGLLAWRLTN